MQDPESAFDLRKFPPGEHDRFVRSVTNGKNQTPPWGDLLKVGDIEALWAYVTMGEKNKRLLPVPWRHRSEFASARDQARRQPAVTTDHTDVCSWRWSLTITSHRRYRCLWQSAR
jgi:hypothetical protein